MSELKTNEDLVLDLMNFSPYGPLGQVFVMEAIRRYAEQVVNNPLKEDPNSFFNRATWNGIAIDVKKRCDAFYNRGKHNGSDT